MSSEKGQLYNYNIIIEKCVKSRRRFLSTEREDNMGHVTQGVRFWDMTTTL